VLQLDDTPGPSAEPPPEPLTTALAEGPSHRKAGVAALARRWAMRIIPVILLVAAAAILWKEFHHLSLAEVARAMDDWGHARILLTLVLAAFSFGLMGVVEWVGLRWAGASVPWGPAVAASFVANAIAHAVGANLLVSGALRARFYERYQVNLTQVAATTLFSGMSFAVGIAALGGAGLALSPAHQVSATAVPLHLARVIGWSLVLAVAGYVILCAVRRAPLRAFGRSLTLPSAGDAMAQIVIGVVDNAVAAAIIWLLMPLGAVHYLTFVGAYAVATVVGLVSSVPGGAGVFEGSISALLPNAQPAPLAAAFLGYRLAYYLLPLLIACLALAGDTIHRAATSRD
jgi:uncharacterized membrane protein YbhN (UPF0104 family)